MKPQVETHVDQVSLSDGSIRRSLMETDPSVPLLGGRRGAAPIVITTTTVSPLNRFQRWAISFFSFFRITRGLSFMIYPALGLSSFDIPQSGATYLLGSLVGGRDVLIGALLISADQGQVDGDRREIRRALLTNLLSDVIDTVILIFSAASMWHWRNPIIEIAVVAAMAIAEHLTLWSMSDADDGDGARGYQKRLQANEDKKMRLDTWLLELRRAEESQARGASPAPAGRETSY